MSDWKYKRLFEILPGAITWFFLLTPLFLGIFVPRWFAIYMIFYISFWLYRTFVMSYRLIDGYVNYKRDIKTDWMGKLAALQPEGAWREIYHLLILATAKEDIEILRASIRAAAHSNFPKENIIFAFTIEERPGRERAEEICKVLKKEFAKDFAVFIPVIHPKDTPGEVIGKGSNITYAGREALKVVDQMGIPHKNVVVTTLDADHIVDRNYLADLTYKYVTDPDPIHKSFQPLPMFFNNIWDVPMMNRLIAMGSSIWQLIVTTRPSRLRNFAAHAQSLAALVITDFWSTTTIVEDGHQFWRSYYRFNGCHEVVPMYTPIYQDAVLADTFKDTLREQYLQKRRWAWGVSDIPYVMEHTFKDKKIPLFDRWANALILWESHLSWSTTSLILATSAWIPWIFDSVFRHDILSYSFYSVYSRIVTIAWIGMIITLIISTLLSPPRKGKKPFKRLIADWILTPFMLPISNIFFSSIPALESQTRLMFGRYLGSFHVTAKSTRRSNLSEGSDVKTT